MTTDRVVLSGLTAELILRSLPCGGWAALAWSSQPALEPTCFAALVLGLFLGGALGRAQEFLLHTQNPNGSWPAFAGDDTDGAWVTSLAFMALHDVVPAIPGNRGTAGVPNPICLNEEVHTKQVCRKCAVRFGPM